MEIYRPRYGGCIANLACSVLKYFGAEPPNSTLPSADKVLSREYKNVVVLLLDGMGVNIMNKHLSPEGFFRRNLKDGCGERLKGLFRQHFGDEFLLLSHDEAKQSGLFGTGEDHPLFDGLIGDYLAVAVGDIALSSAKLYKGQHAGLSRDEMLIPLIAYTT